MSNYDIEYRDGNTGEKRSHRFSGNRVGAEGWLKALHRENGGKATLYDNKPYDRGPRRELNSVGDSSDPPKTSSRY